VIKIFLRDPNSGPLKLPAARSAIFVLKIGSRVGKSADVLSSLEEIGSLFQGGFFH
jgi:hypothetical protein